MPELSRLRKEHIMYECIVCGARLTKKYATHAPKAIWIGQPLFDPCPGKLVEVSGDVVIDGLPAESFDRAARLDSGMPSREELMTQNGRAR